MQTTKLKTKKIKLSHRIRGRVANKICYRNAVALYSEVNETFVSYNQNSFVFAPFSKYRKLSPIIKWPGGKEQELKHIAPNLPTAIRNYFEPFVGGGAVYTALQAQKMFINDRSDELINLYKMLASKNKTFFLALNEIAHNWNLLEKVTYDNKNYFIRLYKQYSADKIVFSTLSNSIYEFVLKNAEQFNGMFSTVFNFNIQNFLKEINRNLVEKINRMKKIEMKKNTLPDNDILDNIETALKSAFYMHFRHIYNNLKKYNVNKAFSTAIFLLIRNFAYSGMFRYNSKGEFNVPYGGIGYNRKDFAKKIHYLQSKELHQHLSKTVIENVDFEDFLEKYMPTKDDFIFLDPPYDTEFSTYAKNDFTKNDQKRLANYLINRCNANWMLIIKNTDFISDIYNSNKLNIKPFNKKYLVSFMNRNDKNVEHLLITNY